MLSDILSSHPFSGKFLKDAHIIPFRVYYEDTDAAGVMYYANYLKFAERARTEALRAAGVEQSELLAEERLGFVVARCEIHYRRPATLDDVVTVKTQLVNHSKVRLRMQQTLHLRETEIATISVDVVMVDARMSPVKIPEKLLALLCKKLKPLERSDET